MANVIIGNQKYYSTTNGYRTYVVNGSLYGNRTPDNACYYAETSDTNPLLTVIPDGIGSMQNHPQGEKIAFGDLFYEWGMLGEGDQISQFTVTFYDSDGETVLQSRTINLQYYLTNAKDVSMKNLNFYVRLNTNTADKYPDTFGIMCMVTGTILTSSGGLNPVPQEKRIYQFPYSTEFDNATLMQKVQDITEIFSTSETSEEIIESLELDESNEFKISQFTRDVFEKEIYTFDRHLVYPDQTIEFKTSGGVDIAYNVYSWAYDHTLYDISPSNQVFIEDFATYFKKLGSDMLRKTGDDKFYNGIDLTTSTDPTQNHLVSLTPSYEIPFSKGKIVLNTAGTNNLQVSIYDKNGTQIGSTTTIQTRASIGGVNLYSESNCAIQTVWLAEQSGEFYLVSFMRDSYTYDSNGNPLYTWDNKKTCGAFVVIHKFSTPQNELLNSAVVYKTTTDKTNISEEELQQPVNQPKDDDKTKWESGDLAGENTGIRHNGSDIVDGSDLSQTADEQVDHISAPTESGADGYPTPMNTGMIAVFNPSKSQLQSFASDLTDDSVLTKITKYLASNPMDIIISCHICILPDIDTGNEYKLQYGLYQSTFRMPIVTQRFYECDMGSLNLREYGNSWKDYEPTTKLTIYLPCIGFRQIDADAVMGMELKLKYIFDVITGDVLAELSAVNEASKVDNPFYIWQGNTMSKFPFTANDYDAQIQNSINGVLGTASALGGAFTGNVAAITGGLASALNSAHNMKPQIRCTGTVTSAFTHMMGMTPYIIRQVPMNFNAIPYQYKHLQGQMSNAGVVIGDVMSQNITETKYVKFISADIDGIGAATEEEKQMILSMLQGGVFI